MYSKYACSGVKETMWLSERECVSNGSFVCQCIVERKQTWFKVESLIEMIGSKFTKLCMLLYLLLCNLVFDMEGYNLNFYKPSRANCIQERKKTFGIRRRPTWIKCRFDLPPIQCPQDKAMEEIVFNIDISGSKIRTNSLKLVCRNYTYFFWRWNHGPWVKPIFLICENWW